MIYNPSLGMSGLNNPQRGCVNRIRLEEQLRQFSIPASLEWTGHKNWATRCLKRNVFLVRDGSISTLGGNVTEKHTLTSKKLILWA